MSCLRLDHFRNCRRSWIFFGSIAEYNMPPCTLIKRRVPGLFRPAALVGGAAPPHFAINRRHFEHSSPVNRRDVTGWLRLPLTGLHSKFPANRELNREFRKDWPSGAPEDRKYLRQHGALDANFPTHENRE